MKTGRKEDRKTGRLEDWKTGRQEDRKTGGQEDRKTGRKEDRKTYPTRAPIVNSQRKATTITVMMIRLCPFFLLRKTTETPSKKLLKLKMSLGPISPTVSFFSITKTT